MKPPARPPLFTLLLATLLVVVSVASRAAVVCSGPDSDHGTHVALSHETTGCDDGHGQPEPASPPSETPCDDTPVEIDQVRPDHDEDRLLLPAAVWACPEPWGRAWASACAGAGPRAPAPPLTPPGLPGVASVRFNL